MALVETGKMTDIKLGGTDVQLVLQGSKVIWERDRYPEVVWPEEYYKPLYNKGPYGQFHLSLFIPRTGKLTLDQADHLVDEFPGVDFAFVKVPHCRR